MRPPAQPFSSIPPSDLSPFNWQPLPTLLGFPRTRESEWHPGRATGTSFPPQPPPPASSCPVLRAPNFLPSPPTVPLTLQVFPHPHIPCRMRVRALPPLTGSHRGVPSFPTSHCEAWPTRPESVSSAPKHCLSSQGLSCPHFWRHFQNGPKERLIYPEQPDS